MQLWIFRNFVGLIDTGKILDFSRQCTAIQPFRITRNTFFDWRIYENLDELVWYRKVRAPCAVRI